ncbi:MAG: hypothetical protein M0037_13305 [Betaproteobacteria bacterium]|nr:hypothetical protein [Betaproteobacteria bacterium]
MGPGDGGALEQITAGIQFVLSLGGRFDFLGQTFELPALQSPHPSGPCIRSPLTGVDFDHVGQFDRRVLGVRVAAQEGVRGDSGPLGLGRGGVPDERGARLHGLDDERALKRALVNLDEQRAFMQRGGDLQLPDGVSDDVGAGAAAV